MLVSIDYVNATEGYRMGDEPPHEPWTENRGQLFRALVRELGRCTGRVYIDGPNGEAVPIGWHFLKRCTYEDARPSWPKSKRTYLREAWVTLHAAPITVTREVHYLNAQTWQAA